MKINYFITYVLIQISFSNELFYNLIFQIIHFHLQQNTFYKDYIITLTNMCVTFARNLKTIFNSDNFSGRYLRRAIGGPLGDITATRQLCLNLVSLNLKKVLTLL